MTRGEATDICMYGIVGTQSRRYTHFFLSSKISDDAFSSTWDPMHDKMEFYVLYLVFESMRKGR